MDDDYYIRQQTTLLGATNSPRWRCQGTDRWGHADALAIWPTGTNYTAWNRRWYDSDYCFGEIASAGFPGTTNQYDHLGRASVSVMNGNGCESRRTWSRQCSVNIAGKWYQATTNFVYLTDGNNTTPTVVSIALEQLSCFSGNEMARTIEYDADLNQTITTTIVDRGQNKVAVVTSKPATSSLSATNVVQSGLLRSASTLSVAAPTLYFHDDLGRTNRIQDSLGFSSYIAYDPNTGWIASTTDPAGHTTSYTYYGITEANAGKVKCQTDANGKKTYYSYTPRGEAFRVWGDVPYPAEYHYNACGDLTNLVTFRGGSGWTSSAWPAVSAGGLKPATDGHFKTSHSEARSSYHFRSSDQELSIAR
jgi:YD repeat-containing protein